MAPLLPFLDIWGKGRGHPRRRHRKLFEFGLGITVSPAIVRVTVHDGKVSLDGQLDLKSQVSLVEQMTRHIDGIVDVDMSMTYRRDDTDDNIEDAMTVDITHEPWRG